MSKIVMKAEYLTALSQEIQQVAEQIRQLDASLQQSIQGAAWESRNRSVIIGLYQSHQQRFWSASGTMQELSQYVGKTRDEFQQEDASNGSFITGFNWMAPFDGPGSTVGTLAGAYAVGNLAVRVRNGYMVRQQLDRNTPRVLVRDSYASVQKNKTVNGRPRDYKIYYVRDIEAKMANGLASGTERDVAAMLKPSYGVTAALKDKLGWASVGVDIYTDTRDNMKEGASGDKVAGDIVGNVAMGAATMVGATLLTAAIMPAAAPVLAVGAVGFGVSVGLTYLTEGIKFNVDLDKDGQDDSVKDMVKHGAKAAISTVAGWFK